MYTLSIAKENCLSLLNCDIINDLVSTQRCHITSFYLQGTISKFRSRNKVL